MSIFLYPSDRYEEVMEAAQPIVDDQVAPLILAQPVIGTDGSVNWYAHIHPYSEEQEQWLLARMDGISEAAIVTEFPSWWTSLSAEL
jgi:hypothetical protein